MTTYIDIERSAWAPLATWETRPLSAHEISALSGVVEVLSLAEVEQVYLPLARLGRLRFDATRRHSAEEATFLGIDREPPPFLIGLAGSVAVGKSTTARVLQALLERGGLTVARVTTDGFLFPNAELEQRGILHRKGFPESYDVQALLRFVAGLKAGERVGVPVYSHHAYDVTEERVELCRPDIAIIEGLNVLQTGQGPGFVSDFFDWTLYVDADEVDVQAWYLARFELLRRTAFTDPAAHFHRYAELTDDEAREVALGFWTRTNRVNLEENILATRERADVILCKGADHRIRRIRLRNT